MTPADAMAVVAQADDALRSAGVGPFPLPIGSVLPVVAGTVAALRPTDWWVPGLRERAGAVARGLAADRLAGPWTGAKPYRVAPPGGSAALRALYAVGLAMADPDRRAVVHLGIGSASDGALHEAMNLAALLDAPVTFVVAVQPLQGAPLGPQLATSPARMAQGFGIATTEVDGSDAQAVHDAVAAAGEGPHLIEARLSPTPVETT